MGSLRTVQKVRRYVLEWFRYLMNDQSITAENVSSAKFILTLGHVEAPYNYDELYAEINGWAKREFCINLKLTVNRDPTADFNQFDFLVTVQHDNSKQSPPLYLPYYNMRIISEEEFENEVCSNQFPTIQQLHFVILKRK